MSKVAQKRSSRPRGFRDFCVDGEDYWIRYEGRDARVIPVAGGAPFNVSTWHWTEPDDYEQKLEEYVHHPMQMIAEGIRQHRSAGE